MSLPRVVVAPDSFKGSLGSAAAAAALARGLRRGAPGAEVVEHAIADGGEGTVDLVLRHGFAPVDARVAGPLGTTVEARFALRGDTAVVEMATAAGLGLLPGPPDDGTARAASTAGVGALLATALDAGARRIVLGVGGSATTDGGAGAVAALGARLLDAGGAAVAPGGAALLDLDRLDLGGLDPRLHDTELLVACDVDNPLTGPAGAAAVYGPQKGAGPETVALLDRALTRWADAVAAATGRDLRDVPGAGAAGGLGFAAAALLDARIVQGIGYLLEMTGFADAVRGADLVVVGEGRLDAQSLRGKGPIGVAADARAAGAEVVAVAGRSDLADPAAAGLAAVYELRDLEPDPVASMRRAADLLEVVGERIAADRLS
ncbi:glycerate kinase [Blastococcus sp. TF02A-26]|uniref:glycerate kinase n=1 Tax=Blastococcus sp. TF02A-26 TaxID=2250577 RepID=UPI000DEA522D|nr:glycerate kinase [Blastococcus sp. TF02A-26]RBY83387.1 glycerate kinase [Blastococcus sp. TF02A-26]